MAETNSKLTLSSATKIPSRWIPAIRLAWIILAAFYAIVYLVTLPGELTKPAEFKVQLINGYEWSQQEVESSASALGISTTFLETFSSDKFLKIPVFIFYVAIGSFIFWKKPDDWVAVSVSLLMMTVSNSTILLAGKIPIFAFIDRLTNSFTSVLLFLIFFIFPDGRFSPRWLRWVALYSGIIQLWRLVSPLAYDNYGFVLLLPSLVSMLFSQIYRYTRMANSTKRLQIKWVVFLNGAAFGALGLVFLAYAIFPQFSSPGPIGLIGYLTGTTVWRIYYAVLLPSSFAIALLRSRLWDIDILIRRTLVYSLLTGLLGLVYFGGVVLLQGLLTADRGAQTAGGLNISASPNPFVIVLSTLAIAALANPLRHRIQAFIDLRFYRQKYDAEKALTEFASVARSSTELSNLNSHLVSLVDETLQPASLALWMKSDPNHPTRKNT